MQQFLKNIAYFVCSFCLAINGLLYAGAYFLKSKKPFEIPQDTKVLIIGNSQPEAAFNDKLINHTYNFSKEAEPYFYTYIKLRGLLKVQNTIEKVYIQVSPWEFTSERDNWVWGKSNLQSMYWKFLLYYNTEEYTFLASKSWDNLVNVHLFQSLTRLYKRVALADPVNVRADYGGYVAWPETELELGGSIPDSEKISYTHENVHVVYLEKIVQFLKEKGIQVVFIQTPLHDSVRNLYSKQQMLDQLPSSLKGIPYLDFSDFQVDANHFSDEFHLNAAGAAIFSEWFNQRLQEFDGDLDKK